MIDSWSVYASAAVGMIMAEPLLFGQYFKARTVFIRLDSPRIKCGGNPYQIGTAGGCIDVQADQR